MTRALSITSPEGGTFEAFLAESPGHGEVPAIVVIPSIWGITSGLQHTMERYARKGFIVIAADPFWRTMPGPLSRARAQEAIFRMEAWNVSEGISDIQATLGELEMMPRWNHKWAVLGFCFGGQHAMFGLTRLGADASVAFHGVGCELYVGETDKITKPFSLHFAEYDAVVPLSTVEVTRKALAGKNGEIFVYDGVSHGFAQEESDHYHPIAAKQSEERAFAILAGLK
jgi:carboxymethylenebutenolidase